MAAFYSLLCKAIKKQPAGRSGRLFCLLLPKKMHPEKPCGPMDLRFCAIYIFAFLRFFQTISEPPY